MNNETENIAQEIDIPEEHVNVAEDQDQEEKSYEDQIKEFIDKFDNNAIATYSETQNELYKLLDIKFNELKQNLLNTDIESETPDDMFFIEQNNPILNAWMNNAQYVPLLADYDKLDKVYLERHDDIKSKLQVYQMLYLGYRYESEEESENYLHQIDNQLLYAVSTMFTLQMKSTIRTVFGSYIRGLLDHDEFDSKVKVLTNIKEIHSKYLAELDLPTDRLEEVYQDTLEALDIILDLAKSETAERRSEKFNKFTQSVVPTTIK